jgi:hypothetical protein
LPQSIAGQRVERQAGEARNDPEERQPRAIALASEIGGERL